MAANIRGDVRRHVQERAGARCEYCHTSERLTGYALEIDHVIPQVQGGSSDVPNLALACRRCNAYKSRHTHAVDPQTEQLTPLFNPRAHMWAEHFTWSEDKTHILGRTAIGRATVAVLRMNDFMVVRARALWVSAGWHPPTA